ncbi:MAG: TrmH family RNA methyltransferase [Candidatus Kryptoniota bacterium]
MILTNAKIKTLSKLKDRPGRYEQGLFLIEGKRSVMEALDSQLSIELIVTDISKASEKFSDVFEAARRKDIMVAELPSTKFRKLETTENSQGIIAVAKLPDWSLNQFFLQVKSAENALVIFLDRISDPGNAGAIFRTAEWFGLDAVILSKGCVDAFNPKVVRSSLSALTRIKVFSDLNFEDIWLPLKDSGFEFYCATQENGESYVHTSYAKKGVFVFGSEAAGISDEIKSRCTKYVSIPRFGKMESLNVSVASGVIISEVIRQRSAKINRQG